MAYEYPPAKTTGHDAVAGEPYQNILPRSLPYSKTSGLDLLNPRSAPVPRSSTTALPTKSPHQTYSGAAYYAPDEVNRKVAAMLAATEALKPKSPPPDTKKKTMGRRVLSKLAGLFGSRRKNKEKGEKRAVDCANPGTGEADAISTWPQQSLSARTPYIPSESVETRAPEPDRPVERRIPRKPVPNVRLQAHHANLGEPSSSRRTTTGPAPETGGVEVLGVYTTGRHVNVHDLECGGEEDDDCGASRIDIHDPFASELSFDNLQGFLTTEPVGASTPRGSKDWSAGFNPPRDYFSPPERMSYFSMNDADDELTDYEGKGAASRRRRGKAPESPAIRVQRASTSAASGGDGVEPDRAKKHPSPSKESLEELSRQFDALLYKKTNRGEPSARVTTGLSPVTAAFPRPPVRIPASQTSALGREEYRGLVAANPQASSLPWSPTAQQLGTMVPSAKAPAFRSSEQMAERGPLPRQLAGGPGAQASQYRTGDIDEQQEDGEQYIYRLRRA